MIDFTHLSPRNLRFPTQEVVVANGTVFSALVIDTQQQLLASNILYLHVHRVSRKCYVGITVQEARKRWFTGTTYKLNGRFGYALKKYGWDAFDSFVLAFIDDRDALNKAEVAAIAAAGGHKCKFTYNLSPGGDLVADNDIPIIGVYLPTGESRSFKSGSEAARILEFGSTDTPMAVVRGKINTAQGWWFRLADDDKSRPPATWGREYFNARIREAKARPLVAINYTTKECHHFETVDDAAEVLHVQQSEVSAVAHGKTHSAGGWWFCFEDDDRPMPELHGHKATRKKRDKEIYAVHLKSGECRVFRNCTVADHELQIYQGGAAAVASGGRVSADDWWFSYDKDAIPPREYKGALVARARSKAVVATELATGQEQYFDSAKAAAISLGMSRASICYVISGKKKAAKGFMFRFALKT